MSIENIFLPNFCFLFKVNCCMFNLSCLCRLDGNFCSAIAPLVFPFPETAQDVHNFARTFCRTVSALYNSTVWASTRWVSKPEAACSNPAVGHIVHLFRDTRLRFLIFHCRKQGFFDNIYGFLIKGLCFLENYPSSNENEANRLFSILFKKLGNIFYFPKKQKKFKLIKLLKNIK